MAIPSKRHEDVRDGQQQNRSHNCLRRTVVSLSLTLCNGQPLQNMKIRTSKRADRELFVTSNAGFGTLGTSSCAYTAQRD
jgi:hypothetical protein